MNRKTVSWRRVLKRDYQLILLALPAIIYLFIFNYVPMYGVQIAFKDFQASKGIAGSPWVGFEHFRRFFTSYQFERILSNTLLLSFEQLLFSFPMPIILALLLNQTRQKRFKKIVQTVTYAPHFISVVVLVGMLNLFLSPNSGIINHIFRLFGMEPVFFLGKAQYFRPVYIISGIWQSTGWGSIIYLASLSSVDPGLYEAARIDGCGRLGLIRYIDLPSLLPTIVIMLIMNVGRLMDLGFQKAYLMQNPLNTAASEIISTYVYKVGMIDAQYSYSTAVGLFNSVVNLILLVTVNQISKKTMKTSLW